MTATPVMRTLRSPAETARLAARLAPHLAAGDVVTLAGDLGAGKTTFARGLLAAFGHRGEVPSPTFTLVQVYDDLPVPVWHVDLYRLAVADDLVELGIAEALAGSIVLIEWAERAAALLPADRLDVRLDFADAETARRLTLTGSGRWAAQLDAIADAL
ncbi:MAG: tRNA (adenosine(37)-N6)-threonylcarbamoyltransferase complex ATPase subunit type 1 TsaE [Alphaproteobacteria bacterium]